MPRMTDDEVAQVAPSRFWERVEKTPTCWLWHGKFNGVGYGQLHIGQVSFLAHRFSYELVFGPIALGLHIDHLCRNRRCVNPAHLEPVTMQENLRRGRKVQGEIQGSAKLTDNAVREIRRRRQAGESLKSLAKSYGVCQSTVSAAARGALWKHVDNGVGISKETT